MNENHQSNPSECTLRTFIKNVGAGKPFVIPDYQRGYIWGQKPPEGFTYDAATHLCKSLHVAFSEGKDIFLQGITYCRDAYGRAVLVDGQQRTTFLYILLRLLGHTGFEISYDVRAESDKFLKEITTRTQGVEDPKCKFQDIFFFNRTIRIIRDTLLTEGVDTEKLLSFLLDRIKFIFVEINQRDAVQVFTMMNGNKAAMKPTELIKAELLRVSSLKDAGVISEYENIQIRGRLAREWDKWLYWWNRPQVAGFFLSDSEQMGWLLKVYLNGNVSLDNFKAKLGSGTVREAKLQFRELRLVQKRFEDIFNDAVLFNYTGFILRATGARLEFLKWYINDLKDLTIPDKRDALKAYFNGSLIGMTHLEILAYLVGERDVWNNKAKDFFDALAEKILYKSNYSKASRWFLWRNILSDNVQGENRTGRKFDFSVWEEKSLEHIFPKSKMFHIDTETGEKRTYKDEEWDEKKEGIDRAEIPHLTVDDERDIELSEHSIGNLVLLYGKDNSSFGDKEFEDKKSKFFTPEGDDFKSLHLLHTVKVFARSTWTPADIAAQALTELTAFCSAFGLKKNIEGV